MLEQLKTAYGDKMRLVYRHFPLTSIHDKASLSAVAAEAAGLQDAFWPYHDLLFEKAAEWTPTTPDEAQQLFIGYAKELGLDTTQFTNALQDPALLKKVQQDELTAQQIGLGGTPSVFVNGYYFPSEQLPLNPEGVDFFMRIINLVKHQYNAPEQVINPAKKYQATVATEKGDIVINLDPALAPVNVNSFVFLAQQGWYDNGSFHRVLPNFMAQGGDPSGVGVGWPGYRCDDEIAPNQKFDRPGLVAMANSGPNSNGGQFFITYTATQHLNGGYTIIGELASGQEVVNALTPRDPDQKPTFFGDKILSVTVTEKQE